MLDIVFGSVFCDEVVMDNRIWFKRNKQPEWFEDDFAKRVISSIDKAEVLFEEALKDRWGHGMSTDKLSTGTKTLLCLHNSDGIRFNGSMMGDNCVPFLMEIAKVKDVKIMLEHLMAFQDADFEWITVDDKSVTADDYEDRYFEWSEWVDTESREYYERKAAGECIKPIKPRLD